MSTRAAVIFKDGLNELYFYRHSDGYPEATGEDLKEFVEGYQKHLRPNIGQSAGHLIVRGHKEYSDTAYIKGYEWKVGAYEPMPYSPELQGDLEYFYTIDLEKKVLTVSKKFNGKQTLLKYFGVEEGQNGK